MKITRRQFLRNTLLGSISAAFSLSSGCKPGFSARRNKPSRPNIIIIMADDMGFSDAGCFGGEIHTPNLDRLAENGLRFTQFYNTAKCHSSRVSLLTGLYCTQAGDESLSRATTIGSAWFGRLFYLHGREMAPL